MNTLNNYINNGWISNNILKDIQGKSSFNLSNNISNSNNYFKNLLTNNNLRILKGGLGIATSILNYNSNKEAIQGNYLQQVSNANLLGLQAQTIESQAMEQINMEREKLNEAIGNKLFQTVNSGIKTSSGTIQTNIENSAKELGEDEQKAMRLARIKARQLEIQQQMQLEEARHARNVAEKQSKWGMGLGIGSALIGIFL